MCMQLHSKGALCASQSPPWCIPYSTYYYHSTFTFPPVEAPDSIISFMCSYISSPQVLVYMFVHNGAGSVPTGVFPNNGIVITRSSGVF